MPARTPQDTHALLEAAFNARDLEAFLAVYDPDATLIVPPGGDVVHGRQQIRRALEPVFALRPTAKMEVVQQLESDGLALTHGRWTIIADDDGDLVEMTGRGCIVSRRQPDGTWLVVLDNPMSPA